MVDLTPVARNLRPCCGYRLDSDDESVYCPNCGWRPIELWEDRPSE
jgi:anaerobic ribonucleoside-triphosphate reductase